MGLDSSKSPDAVLATASHVAHDARHDHHPHRAAAPKRRRAPRPEQSLGGALRALLVRHQLGLALNLVLLVVFSHICFPSLRPYTSAFFTLSYPTPAAGLYAQGARDLYLVGTFVVLFTALRAGLLDYVLLPLARGCGIRRAKGQTRFAEQAYVLLYYGFYWGWGVWLFVQDTPADVNDVRGLLISLWKDFPRLALPGAVKLYYLSQLAQWIQMIMVIHLEARRKDHYQMLMHHLVTVALMVCSYGYRQWRVGIAILVCMDMVDCVFPLAKILRYMSLQTACDIMFGVFVLSWIFSRHICYLAICWSIYAHVNESTMFYGTYSTTTGAKLSSDGGSAVAENLFQSLWNPAAPTFAFNANIRWSFLGLLLALQTITLVWLAMIMRVVARVLRGEGADDSRSDDEDEAEAEDEEPDDIETKPRFIEVDTTSEEHAWPPTTRKPGMRRTKSKGISSGLNLGDHKDLLNRIGCLSEEQLARERDARGEKR